MKIEDILNMSFNVIGWMKAIMLIVAIYVIYKGTMSIGKPIFIYYIIDIILIFLLVFIVSIIEVEINGSYEEQYKKYG